VPPRKRGQEKEGKEEKISKGERNIAGRKRGQ
jgi:hypothetical protein